MEVTLRALLSANKLQLAVPLAGLSGLERRVSSICVLDSPTGYIYVHNNELVITSGYFIANEQIGSQADLIDNLVERGASGMLIKSLYFKDHEVPESIICRADALGFPVIGLPDYYSSHRELIAFFDSSVYCQGLESFMNKADLLSRFRSSIKLNSLPGLAKLLYQLGGKNVTILFNMCCVTFPSTSESSAFSQQISSFTSQRHAGPSKLFPGLVDFVSDEAFSGASAVGLGVEFGSEPDALGSLWIDCSRQEPDENDLVLLKNAQLACEIEFRHIAQYQQRQEQQRVRLIEQLLSGQTNPWRESTLALAGYHSRIPLDTQVLVVSCNGTPGLCLAAKVTAQDYFEQKSMVIVTHAYQNCAVAFLPTPCQGLSELLGGLREALRARLPDEQLVLGLGQAVPLRDASISYEQARYAALNGETVQGSQPFHEFKKMGFYRLACPSAHPNELRSFCNDYIGPLVKLNKSTNLDLLNTLNVFFECHENYSRAGKLLFLKPNAIRYRIELIEKACGVSFNNDFDLLNMKMALKFMHTVSPGHRTGTP
ncbi:MAG: PucR family transcriptional regulator ligand-binding domain-containing protein [Coriobacteriales bacterium]|jgi:purine catabolism regulator|nr:PucR family transcriptional regulator ligand-binding domain-containing protein [Coriobacteriales bacterium]